MLCPDMQPEIFNVCASEGVSSVWEEPVEYQVDTPFSALKQDQRVVLSSLNGLTPPPTPRRGLPYPQYMGQITPTRRLNWMQIPQSRDLDITPVTTPLKVCGCLSREQHWTCKLYPCMHIQTVLHCESFH